MRRIKIKIQPLDWLLSPFLVIIGIFGLVTAGVNKVYRLFKKEDDSPADTWEGSPGYFKEGK